MVGQALEVQDMAELSPQPLYGGEVWGWARQDIPGIPGMQEQCVTTFMEFQPRVKRDEPSQLTLLREYEL